VLPPQLRKSRRGDVPASVPDTAIGLPCLASLQHDDGALQGHGRQA